MKIIRHSNNQHDKDNACNEHFSLSADLMKSNFLLPLFVGRTGGKYHTYEFSYQSLFSLSPSDGYKQHQTRKPDAPCFLKLAFLDTAFDDNYGHCLHDILPALLCLDSDYRFDQIIARRTPLMSSLIKLLGLNFKKISFIDPGQELLVNCFRLYKFTLFRNCGYQINYKMSMSFKNRLDLHINKTFKTTTNKRLIYCSRNHSSDVKHARLMDNDNELKIIEILKNFSISNGLNFTFFTGQEDGKTMSHEKQLLLFREAKIVIGPHGSAMSNVIYLNPENKPKVCEFSSGPESFPFVKHGGRAFDKNYNHLNSFIFDELYDYSLISFTKYSTPELTFIDLGDLKTFLDSIYSD